MNFSIRMKNSLEVGDWKLRFGKYKEDGLTFRELVERDPGYARWLSDIHQNARVRAYLKQSLPPPRDE